ncbi:hypothetical protein [Sphingomonas sp. Leaf37]|uniref:hypothetical protein n=1 Tax=Sphingomonas sp. Leaf37 TaxID=2876552 RepID=UPI001E4D665A|nr:hypothetical protein [Sphingomonas sp. Leaf37]
MAGFLTRIFDSDEAQASDGTLGTLAQDQAHNQDADQGAGGTDQSADSQSGSVDGGLTLDVDPTITLHSEMGGTYYGLDGSETTWSRTDDVTLSVDLEATANLVGTITQEFTADG